MTAKNPFSRLFAPAANEASAPVPLATSHRAADNAEETAEQISAHAEDNAADADTSIRAADVSVAHATSSSRAADESAGNAEEGLLEGELDASTEPEQLAAIIDATRYSLTVQQGRELFLAHRRAVPATRTLQEYCKDKKIDAEQLPSREWLINEPSLLAFIASRPELEQSSTIASALPPEPDRAADNAEENAPSAHAPVITTTRAADVSVAHAENDAAHAKEAVRAAEESAGNANDDDPIGETRTLAQLLIENAGLSARLEERDMHHKAMISRLDTHHKEVVSELKNAHAQDVRHLEQAIEHTKDIGLKVLDAVGKANTRDSDRGGYLNAEVN